RTARWRAERDNASDPRRRVNSVFLRLSMPDGHPFEEEFLCFLPFSFFSAPVLTADDMRAAEEARRQWNEGEVDCQLTCYFASDIHVLAQELRNWCDNRRTEFPFRFESGGIPEPITRSACTVRLFQVRDRVWHRDRPI